MVKASRISGISSLYLVSNEASSESSVVGCRVDGSIVGDFVSVVGFSVTVGRSVEGTLVGATVGVVVKTYVGLVVAEAVAVAVDNEVGKTVGKLVGGGAVEGSSVSRCFPASTLPKKSATESINRVKEEFLISGRLFPFLKFVLLRQQAALFSSGIGTPEEIPIKADDKYKIITIKAHPDRSLIPTCNGAFCAL